jgi:hypothetical protein
LMFSGHPYRLSGTAQIRDSTTLVRIPLFWYDDFRDATVATRNWPQWFIAVTEAHEDWRKSLARFPCRTPDCSPARRRPRTELKAREPDGPSLRRNDAGCNPAR